MALLIFDYTCPKCDAEYPDMMVDTRDKADPKCSDCGAQLVRDMPSPQQFDSIIPTYPGAKARKAGYQHLNVNRPATKTQVGYGGGITKGSDK